MGFKKDKRQQEALAQQLIKENFYVPEAEHYYWQKETLLDRIDNSRRQVRDLALDRQCESLQEEIRFLTDLKPKLSGNT